MVVGSIKVWFGGRGVGVSFCGSGCLDQGLGLFRSSFIRSRSWFEEGFHVQCVGRGLVFEFTGCLPLCGLRVFLLGWSISLLCWFSPVFRLGYSWFSFLYFCCTSSILLVF